MDKDSLINLKEQIQTLSIKFIDTKHEIGKVIIGQKKLIDSLLIALLSNNHILLEGLPGLAKTLSIKTISQISDLSFSRVQFTPDLLPGDLTGSIIFDNKINDFVVKKGPIFANLVLADEINRAPPKVQSSLLESMQEKQITIGKETFKLPNTFLVLATQNPIENEGTYPLPEAQLDRFALKVKVDYPSKSEELEILSMSDEPKVNLKKIIDDNIIQKSRDLIKNIYVDENIKKYIIDFVFATRNPQEYGFDFKNLINFGASPRAGIFMLQCAKTIAFMEQREFVIPEDIKNVVSSVLAHRIILSYEADINNITAEELINNIKNKLPIPV